jgi:hypothetical protein
MSRTKPALLGQAELFFLNRELFSWFLFFLLCLFYAGRIAGGCDVCHTRKVTALLLLRWHNMEDVVSLVANTAERANFKYRCRLRDDESEQIELRTEAHVNCFGGDSFRQSMALHLP